MKRVQTNISVKVSLELQCMFLRNAQALFFWNDKSTRAEAESYLRVRDKV